LKGFTMLTSDAARSNPTHSDLFPSSADILSINIHGSLRASGGLSRDMLRLMVLLNAPGCYAQQDLFSPKHIFICDARKPVSVSAGRFARALLDLLIQRDLCAFDSKGLRAFLTPKARQLLEQRQAKRAVPEAAPKPSPAFEAPSITLSDFDNSPLGALQRLKDRHNKRFLPPYALIAAERLRRDLVVAGLVPQPSHQKSDGALDCRRDAVIAARGRIDPAFKAIGSESADLLMDVCGFLKTLLEVEKQNGWPQRSSRMLLRAALHTLARHYGLSIECVDKVSV
jgi:Domain of unknown function (DUF6456)